MAFLEGIYSLNYASVTKNLLIGGTFSNNPWQRGNSISPTTTNTYTADRWCTLFSGPGRMNFSKSNTGPSFDLSQNTIQNSLYIVCNTEDTTILPSSYYTFTQKIEGGNFLSIAQKPFTISFYVKSSIIGTYCISCRNSGKNQSIVKEYTINQANVWERKIITFEPSPVLGTWDYNIGIGLEVNFVLACGDTLKGPSDVWIADNKLATTNQTNLLAQVNNNISFSVIQLEVGRWTSEIDRRSVGEEILLCYRYYQAYTTMYITRTYRSGPETISFPLSNIYDMRTPPSTTVLQNPTLTNCSNFLALSTDGTKLHMFQVTSSNGTNTLSIGNDGKYCLNSEL